MKKFLLTLSAIIAFYFSQAQVVCILCFDQNDSISSNVTNLLVNGGFETSTCGGTGYICPTSQWYSCDLTGWTCTGGGTGTYAQNLMAGSLSEIVQGSQGVYLGNQYCTPCSNTVDDTSCVIDTGCASFSPPPGFPLNTPDYGGNTGVSISQTVAGL